MTIKTIHQKVMEELKHIYTYDIFDNKISCRYNRYSGKLTYYELLKNGFLDTYDANIDNVFS